MTLEERSRITDETFEEVIQLSLSKGYAYSGTFDTLSNFKRNAETTGITPYQVWLIFASKHWDTITNAVKHNPDYPVDKTEGLNGRINDLITYLILLKCLLQDVKPETSKEG